MKIDLHALGTFNRLAHEGAVHAAASLGELTASEPRVDATAIHLVSVDDLGEEFRGSEFVGVRIGFSGKIAGTAILAMDREGAATLLDALPGGGSQGRIAEVGNILIGGFLDGWADYLGAAIDITPPTYVEGTDRDVVPEGSAAVEDRTHVFAFTSELRASTEAVELCIYLLPEARSFEQLVAGPRGGNAIPVPFDKLTVFNHMTKEGASRASDDLSRLTGMDTTVEISRLSFIPVETISSQIDEGNYAGVVIECLGLPGGYVLVLFDEPSARLVAEELVPTPIVGDEIVEMHRSAIMEIGNIVTSGFIDGWANVLGSAINITPPKFVHDNGQAIFDSVAAMIGRKQEFAFVIDSALVTGDQQISCNIYALPDEQELARALNALSIELDDVDPTGANPIPGMDARYEDL